ncbi:MAG: branched-chain amino acid ABC transporter permease [Desulfobacterales bacterium]|nr:branched-chain amino acid ABC transporter permease [Desulfobacterales bacterium]
MHDLQWKKIVIVILVLLLPCIPFGSSTDYILRILTTVYLYMILSLGLNIVSGFTGLLDLGYVGFYGIGAYTAGLLTIHFNLPFGVIILLAAVNGAIWGILLGVPTLRLTGDYFAIVTFGFSELVVLFIRNELWLTRGPMGISGIASPSFFGHSLSESWHFYYLVLVLLSIVLVIIHRLEDSRIGRAWYAIREDEIAAQCCGINLVKYKVMAFAISASIGAVGGAFYAKWFTFIHPDMFKFWESVLILCLIVLGGMGSIYGTMLGALLIIPLSEVLRIILPQYLMNSRYLIYGIILVIMMRLRPDGLIPFQIAQSQKNKHAQKRLFRHHETYP